MSAERIRWPRVILGAIVMLVLWCLLVFAPALVMAEDYTISWEAPTKCTNGDEIGATPECPLLDGFRVYYGETHEHELPTVDVTDSTLRSWTLELDPTKTYYLVMTAYSPGGESAFSEELTIGVTVTPAPNPPDNLRVTSDDLTAYVLSMTEDNISLVPVGSVPIDTECDVDEGISADGVTANRVPRSAVILAPGANIQSLTAFAACEPF